MGVLYIVFWCGNSINLVEIRMSAERDDLQQQIIGLIRLSEWMVDVEMKPELWHPTPVYRPLTFTLNVIKPKSTELQERLSPDQ